MKAKNFHWIIAVSYIRGHENVIGPPYNCKDRGAIIDVCDY
jgi:hypothetical protein